ncbi:hypothetical protein C0J52_21477 [Blattella germanica]|nr:hypothetical protein C0J52_21477 [Blattella germanica]
MRKILEERSVGGNDVEIEWKQIKEGIQEVAGKVIGNREGHRRKEWFNEDKRNEARQKMLNGKTRLAEEEYKNMRRLTNRMLRRKKEYEEE